MTEPPHTSSYRFFGRRVVVRSAEPAILAALDVVYSRQIEAKPGSPGVDADTVRGGFPGAGSGEEAPAESPPPLEVDILADSRDEYRIVVGSRTVRVPAPEQLVHYAHLVMVNAAAASLTDGTVLHSGAVSSAVGAVLLVGGSGAGKTTLTLALVRDGWRFLSDDFAVLGADGIVQPFPRRANVTDRTVALLGMEPPPDAAPIATFGGQRKWMMDIEDYRSGSIGGPAPLNAVFVLDPGTRTGAGATEWRIEIDHLPSDLVGALNDASWVASCVARPGCAPPLLDVHLCGGAGSVRKLDAELRRRDIAVLSAVSGDPGKREFARQPTLEPVLDARELTLLVPHALSLMGNRFLCGADADSDMTTLTTLATLHSAIAAARAPVYRLRVGPPAATALLVAETARDHGAVPPRVAPSGVSRQAAR